MLSLKTHINYGTSNVQPLVPIKICPHCGGDVTHKPNDTFDLIKHEIIVPSRKVQGVLFRRHVSPKTWEVLLFLLKNIGTFMTTERVHLACFDEEVDTGIVTVHVGQIRRLLEGSNYYIETKYGMGYRMLRKIA